MNCRLLITVVLLLGLSACSGSGKNDPSQVTPSDDPVRQPDCTGDIASDGTLYCLDIPTRTVTATLPDGDVDWRVQIVETDNTTRLDTLILIDDQPWVVASAGNMFGPVNEGQDLIAYVSAGISSGGYIQETVTSGYDYPFDSALTVIGVNDSAIVAHDVFQLLADADPQLPDSWIFIGASMTNLGLSTDLDDFGNWRPTLIVNARRLYPDRHVIDLFRTTLDNLLVELEDGTEHLLPETLLPLEDDPERPLFADNAYEKIVPALYDALNGDRITRLSRQLRYLADYARTSATDSQVLEGGFPDSVAPQGTDSSAFEIVEYDCMNGGKLVSERSLEITYNEGNFPTTDQHDDHEFINCKLSLVGGVNLDKGIDLEAGDYRLDGQYVFDDLNEVAFQNFAQELTTNELTDLALASPGNRSSVTTAEHIKDTKFIVNGPLPTSQSVNITSHGEYVEDEAELRIQDSLYEYRFLSPFGTEQPYLHISGNGVFDGRSVGSQPIQLDINPPLERQVLPTDGQYPPLVKTTGSLHLTAANGSDLLMTALAAEEPYTGLPPTSRSAQLDVRLTAGARVLTEMKTLESLDIPVSIFSGYQTD